MEAHVVNNIVNRGGESRCRGVGKARAYPGLSRGFNFEKIKFSFLKILRVNFGRKKKVSQFCDQKVHTPPMMGAPRRICRVAEPLCIIKRLSRSEYWELSEQPVPRMYRIIIPIDQAGPGQPPEAIGSVDYWWIIFRNV